MARRVNTTKHEIIQVASRMFLEKGYSETSPKMICDELDISTGNLTYYFPSKEHLLSVLVEMLCDFQWKMMEEEANEGVSSVMAICLELTAMAAMCEENEKAKEFYLASYSGPVTLDLIRRNDARRAMEVFGEYCPGWSHQQFMAAEILVSGIEYATMMTTADSAPLDVRIAGALDNILNIFNVPREIRQRKIKKVLAMDYRAIGRRVMEDFKTYVEQTNAHTLEELLQAKASRRTAEG